MAGILSLLRLWWVQVLLVFVASRIVTTALVLIQAASQVASPWAGAGPDYVAFASFWDAEWYLRIVALGYPTELPVDDQGMLQENAWAFMPAYPWLVAALSWVTGAPFQVWAVIVAVACAAGASLAFYRLFVTWLPRGAALAGVALLLANPVSPILQFGYAESMHLLLLGLSLLLLVRRRYWVMLPIVVLMALTRPSGLAFALAMVGHVGYRWWRHRRGEEPLPWRELLAASTVAVVSGVAGLAWAGIAALATGQLDAYTATELVWRRGYVGDVPFIPFTPWLFGARWWAAWWGWPDWLGALALIAVLAAGAAALLSPWMRRLGIDLRIWVAAWLVYLLAVFFPQSSTWRLLLPAMPAVAALAVARSRWVVPVAIVLGIIGQWFWLEGMWRWVPGDWTPP